MLLQNERELIVKYGKKLLTSNLTTGSGGNISIYNRELDLIAITPSGMDYFETTVEDILVIDIEGNVVEGTNKASSETGMHLHFYRHRDDANSIVHTHSKFATAVSCMGWELKPVHYMVGLAGYDVKCAKYAIYGSMDLARNALEAIEDRNAVLLSNHGLLALGSNVQAAFSVAEHLEFVSEIYCITKAMGEPKLISEEEMTDVMKKFNTYKYI